MKNRMSQNIFDYATSELSQDAFISLMVGWFDNSDKVLKGISTNFITKIYDEYNSKYLSASLPPLKIKSIEIIQQHYKIDVFFQVTTEENGVVPFIIEDKTWTEPHSDQLQKYAKRIKEPSIKIFFKTGHITEKDRKLTNDLSFLENGVEKAKYLIIDTAWIYNFLKSYIGQTSNIILHDFFDYLEKNFYAKLYTETGNIKTLKDWNFDDLSEGFVQYEVIKSIKNNILNPNNNLIRYTKNGKLWDTWWTFFKIENKTQFFIKVKKIGKKGEESYRLRFIEYSTSVNKNFNYAILKDIIISLPKSNVKPTNNPRYNAKETELGYLEMENNTLEESVNDISIVIQKFIEKLNGI